MMAEMTEELQDSILDCLEQVIDPELGIDIVNLGLIYGVDIDDEDICTVTMTLTSMGCPLAGIIVEQIESALEDLPEVNDTVVNVIWDPPWTKDRMSRYAKIALGIR